MNTHLVCVRGETSEIVVNDPVPIETKVQIHVPFVCDHVKIKLVAYKSESHVVDNEVDATLENIYIHRNDVLSGLMYLHCSLWPDSPIAIITAPSTLITPDITLPLHGKSVSGTVTFSLRTSTGQLCNVIGEFSVMMEFHK